MLDVGSARNLGWWRVSSDCVGGGRDLLELIEVLGDDLRSGSPVALGLECPLWIPRARSTADLGRARPVDGGRSWSAGAGPIVLAYGLQEIVFIIDELLLRVPAVVATTHLGSWQRDEAQLLLWEAFVSGRGKDREAAEPHISDARAAAVEFASRRSTDSLRRDQSIPSSVSIAALALFTTQVATAGDVLGTTPLVVRVDESTPS
ncbi:MAG: hypothetical protein ACOYOQ_14360 [Microthrixaceae bacterium]